MAQDVAKGEIAFNKCVICHSIGPGAQNKVGPAQNGLETPNADEKTIVLRTPASSPGSQSSVVSR
jgi:cytochrome c2